MIPASRCESAEHAPAMLSFTLKYAICRKPKGMLYDLPRDVCVFFPACAGYLGESELAVPGRPMVHQESDRSESSYPDQFMGDRDLDLMHRGMAMQSLRPTGTSQ